MLHLNKVNEENINLNLSKPIGKEQTHGQEGIGFSLHISESISENIPEDLVRMDFGTHEPCRNGGHKKLFELFLSLIQFVFLARPMIRLRGPGLRPEQRHEFENVHARIGPRSGYG